MTDSSSSSAAAAVVRPDEYTTVVRADGRAFNVRLLRTGDLHGTRRLLVWPNLSASLHPEVRARFADQFGVEIFDVAGLGDPLGRFTAGRYYLEDFLDAGPHRLSMHGGVPEWHLDAPALAAAQAWVRERVGSPAANHSRVNGLRLRWSLSYDRADIELKLEEAGRQAPDSDRGWQELFVRLQQSINNCTAGAAIEDAMAGVLGTLPETLSVD